MGFDFRDSMRNASIPLAEAEVNMVRSWRATATSFSYAKLIGRDGDDAIAADFRRTRFAIGAFRSQINDVSLLSPLYVVFGGTTGDDTKLLFCRARPLSEAAVAELRLVNEVRGGLFIEFGTR